MVRTRCFHCRRRGFDPCLGNYDPASCTVQPDKTHTHTQTYTNIHTHTHTNKYTSGTFICAGCWGHRPIHLVGKTEENKQIDTRVRSAFWWGKWDTKGVPAGHSNESCIEPGACTVGRMSWSWNLLPGFKSSLCSLLGVWPWVTDHLNIPSFSSHLPEAIKAAST